MKLQWHADDDYNKPSGKHLYAEVDGWRISIEKEVVRPGREWCWDISCRHTNGKETGPLKSYRTLRDAKTAALEIAKDLMPT